MFQILKYNNCKIPKEGLNIIRYHSYYSCNLNSYTYLVNDDKETLFKMF